MQTLDHSYILVEKNQNHIGMREYTFKDKENESLLEQGNDAQKWLMTHMCGPVTRELVCRRVEGEIAGEVIFPVRAL